MVGNVTFSTERGRRDHQEDRYLIHSNEKGTLLGIFDGHGSDYVSEYCQDNTAKLFEQFYKLPISRRLETVVRHLNNETNDVGSGSTLSLAYIPHRGITVTCAVLGDSPIVIKDDKGKINISPDHNVRSNVAELDAAIERGGLYTGGYIYRGFGSDGLQMGRALGNAPLGSIISKLPDVYSVKLGPQSFVLLASDGCFDPGHEFTEVAINAVANIIDDGGTAPSITARAIAIPTWDNATAVLWKRMKE